MAATVEVGQIGLMRGSFDAHQQLRYNAMKLCVTRLTGKRINLGISLNHCD